MSLPRWRRDQLAEKRADRYGGLRDGAADAVGVEASDAVSLADLVGWMVHVDYTVKGAGHICRVCRPQQPTAMVPVYRQQLAAKEPCRMCRRPLEEA